ncbi:MAG TPA: DNA repair protein RadA, partial [Synergistaceae bacterium]|nr:DNA repair protein RadA [Synergistaceae bacterium]
MWTGRCPTCGEWGTLEREAPTTGGESPRSAGSVKSVSVTDVPAQERISSGFEELDRVLGGGWVPGG